MNEAVTEKTKKRVLSPDEVRVLVNEAQRDAWALIRSRIEEIDERQQWLIVGRVFNLMFALIYKPVFQVAMETEAKT